MEGNEKIGAMVYLPDEQRIEAYRATNVQVFSEIRDYWMKSEGLVFFPFDRSRQAFFFSKAKVEDKAIEFEFSPNDQMSKEEYLTSVLLAQQSISEGEFSKVVLARNEIIKGKYDAEEAFRNAVSQYPDSHGFYIDLGIQRWVGASPELLIHYEDETIYTMALAGTQLVDQDFTDKEHQEQQMVEEFIEDKLRDAGLGHYVKSEKHERVFSNIKHLKTAYTVKANSDKALELLEVLHPTSAVCGLPRDTSFGFIQDYETMNRSFYSGMTGVIKNSSATFFVNLRCMRFTNDHVELFAGAGITAESNAEAEWEETERKIQTIRTLLESGFE